ncbi:uncharacterized protein LOC129574345 [Sitodiplosis mosellana]|uniref:uncharacterized protein LOC129574345 n=1 Tax=Sitodiplosis mosellana TaxID=263140 RepID=UPI00244378AB|nr:uncharacterized protein LOC129574345 [Sitodiplosis mosellana]
MLKLVWYGALLLHISFATIVTCKAINVDDDVKSLLMPYVNSLLFWTNTTLENSSSNIDDVEWGTKIVVGNRTFFVNTNKQLNWHQADEYCNNHSMFFVAIMSKEEDDAIVEYMKRIHRRLMAFVYISTVL